MSGREYRKPEEEEMVVQPPERTKDRKAEGPSTEANAENQKRLTGDPNRATSALTGLTRILGASIEADEVLALQQVIGNQAVAQLLSAESFPSAPATPEGKQAKGKKGKEDVPLEERVNDLDVNWFLQMDLPQERLVDYIETVKQAVYLADQVELPGASGERVENMVAKLGQRLQMISGAELRGSHVLQALGELVKEEGASERVGERVVALMIAIAALFQNTWTEVYGDELQQKGDEESNALMAEAEEAVAARDSVTLEQLNEDKEKLVDYISSLPVPEEVMELLLEAVAKISFGSTGVKNVVIGDRHNFTTLAEAAMCWRRLADAVPLKVLNKFYTTGGDQDLTRLRDGDLQTIDLVFCCEGNNIRNLINVYPENE